MGKAVVRREGTDVTVLATLLMMHRSLQAAAVLEGEGISAEVIDPRSLVPFDWETVKASVAKTGRVVIVEESPKRNGVGAGDRRHAGRRDDGPVCRAAEARRRPEHARPIFAADGEVLRPQRRADRRGHTRSDGVLKRCRGAWDL